MKDNTDRTVNLGRFEVAKVRGVKRQSKTDSAEKYENKEDGMGRICKGRYGSLEKFG